MTELLTSNQHVQDWLGIYASELSDAAYHALANIVGDPDPRRIWTPAKEIARLQAEVEGLKAARLCDAQHWEEKLRVAYEARDDTALKTRTGYMGNVNGPGCDPDVGPDEDAS